MKAYIEARHDEMDFSMLCRHCGTSLSVNLVRLANDPPSGVYLARDGLQSPEAWLPLRVLARDRAPWSRLRSMRS